MNLIQKPTRLESKALVELAQRQNMALSIFRPLEHQEPFFRNWARQHLLRGGNRSCRNETLFSKAVGDTAVTVRADELLIGDRVFASDGVSLVVTPVESITKFESEAYRLVLSCGRELVATPDHPVMTPDSWRCMTELTAGAKVLTVDGWSDVVSCELLEGLHEIVGVGTATETYVSNGIVSHNSGKSTCAAVMFAGAAIDWDITMGDGTKIPMRRPWQKNRPLRMWVIGFDLKHIGQTIHRLLFQPGLFKIIKDQHTGMYRAYKPWLPEDAARESESKVSPPLIPSRYVEPGSWDWENKKGREFKSLKIKDPLTGHRLAEIYAFSSKADPKAGDPVDFIWIDESIENADHFKEWRARLFDLRGSLIWSSWPAVNNDALAELTEEAIKEAKAVEKGEKKEPLVRETVITLSANKALPQEVREEALGMFTSEEERRARDRGEYVTDLLRMYPLFDEYIHQAIIDGDPDEVSRLLRASGGTPPSDWTIELVLDPGTAHPGVLFCAIPPHKVGRGRSFVVWDELSPDRHDATQLAKLVKEKLGGRRMNRFIIDWQAGRRKAEGFEITIGDNYKRAFKKAGILLDDGDLHWTIGSNNVGGRIGILQEHMHIEPNGLPKLRIVRHRCEKLCAQLTKYKKSCVNNEVKDDRPAAGQTIDLATCYDSETEVLTRSGWRHFEDLNELDSLGTVNMNTGLMEYQTPIALTKRHYCGEMVEVKGRRVDMLVTPLHRMVVRKQHAESWSIVEARNLCKTHSIPLCPTGWVGHRPIIKMARQFNARHQLDEIKDVVSFAELLGWYLAEGCCVKYKKVGRGYQVAIAQAKEWGCRLLEECLDRNPFHYTKDVSAYLISHKQLWHYLKDYGTKSYNKFVPQWVKDSDTEVIQSFLDGYIAGDGHRRPNGCIEVVTTSPQMADDLQELFLKVGKPAHITSRVPAVSVMSDGREIYARRPAYSIRVPGQKHHALLYRKNKQDGSCEAVYGTKQYDGYVYCATVPNGTLIVRRNGRVAVCGNCAEYWLSSNPQYVIPRHGIANKTVAADWAEFLEIRKRASKTKRESHSIGPSYAVSTTQRESV